MPIYALGPQEPTISGEAYVHPDAVVIGSVTIGAESSIWPGAVLRGDDGEIFVGARTSIQDGTIVHTTPFWATTIGDDCVVGHNAHLEGCIVEDGCLVGSGSILLHQVLVQTGALVGAGAVVSPRTVVPTGAMALGVPAVIKENRVDPATMILPGVLAYQQRVGRYREQLRRLD